MLLSFLLRRALLTTKFQGLLSSRLKSLLGSCNLSFTLLVLSPLLYLCQFLLDMGRANR